MPGRRFWILAASLGLALTAYAVEETSAAQKAINLMPNIVGDDLGFEENGKVFVATHARLESRDTVLWAKKIRIDYRTGVITAEGDVVYATKTLRVIGEKVVVDPKTDTTVATNVRFGKSPIYFTAEELKIVKGDKSMKGVRMWNNEPSEWGMHLDISEATYSEKDNWLTMRNVKPHLAGMPFFVLPYYGQEGYKDIPYDIYLSMGNADNKGFFIRTTALARQTPSLWVGGLFDYYTKSGFLYGPALRYDNVKVAKGDTVWKGSFQAGFINDRSVLFLDAFGRLPERSRDFFMGEINGRTSGGIEIAGQIFAQSDPDFVRDFRPNLLNRTGVPQANFEISAPLGSGYLSAQVVAKVDNYQDIVQKYPEVRFDLPQTSLGDSGLTQRSFVTAGYLSERPSAIIPQPVNQTNWSTGRIDAYYGITYPIILQDCLTFKPIAGVRTTGWSTSLDHSGSASKVIGQAGFDLEGLVTGSWDLVADKWGINGMRHTLRPIIQFRALPGADRGIGKLPIAERATAVSVLNEVDLADRADAASTTDTEVVRFGIRNTLATRNTQFGTRNLLRADFYTDWHKGATEAETGRSDFLAHITLTPASWVAIDSFMRLPNGSGTPLESNQSITFNSGDFWRTSVSWVELSEVAPTRQLVFTGKVTLNSVYSAFITSNYDAVTKQSIYQSIGLIQKVGNSWELEYGFQKRVSDRGDSSLGFLLRARLFKF